MPTAQTDKNPRAPQAAPTPLRTRHPCSPGQQRLWLLDRIAPGNPALNIAVRWRLQGRVSGADLNRAFALVLARHPSLRTFITQQDSDPVQVIEPSLSFHIPEIDLTGLTVVEAQADAGRIGQLEARASFDLSAAPLIRATHLRLRGNVSIVLLTVHRIVCDRRSVALLAREIGAICAALHRNAAPALPALPPGYSVYAARRPAPASLRRDDEFWRQALAGLQHFELQPDRVRPRVQSANGDSASLLLDRELTEGLADLSRRHGATLFTASLAALFTLLHRHDGADDIAIGSEIAGRDAAGAQDAIGPFADTLVLRGDLSGEPTFAQLLLRVRDTLAAALDHQGAGLERVIELVNPARDLSRGALFSVHFVFEPALDGSLDDGGLRLEPLPPCTAGVLHDLDFTMQEETGGWRLSCEYNTDLFERETAVRLLAHFAQLLRAAAAEPARPIGSLPMLDEAERHALTVIANRTAADYPKQATVVKLFDGQARRTPAAVAVVCGEHSLSYGELDRASSRLAQELRRRGIGRGSRVGVCLPRSADLVVALLAVLKSGAAYVPLDPGYPAARLAQIVGDAQPAALLTQRALRGRLPESAATQWILLDQLPPAASAGPRGEPAPEPAAAPEDVAYVIYTSGSTGRPKGVQIQHQALTNLLWAMSGAPGLCQADTLLSVTTVSFDIAALELFLPLIVGAKLVLAQEHEAADGAALRALLQRHRATVMQATPVTWQILLAAGWGTSEPAGGTPQPRLPEPRLPEPRLKMLCGGEALPRTLADPLLAQGGELWNMYGPTETTIWSSALRVAPGDGPVPIGPPIANTQFYVLDRHGQLAPSGAPGELFIGGDGIALGYLNLPELTRERFVPDTFRGLEGARLYRTGDRVRRRPDGGLEFLGRFDHQIKLRGFRIELGEIETVLRAQPAVADCVAVAATDAAGEGAIHAYAAVREGLAQSAELAGRLQLALREALPGYMCPSALVLLPALPRTPNGKVDRAALPAPARPQSGAIAGGSAPAGERERRLAKIWRAVLGHAVGETGPDPQANFFEIGGHSLLAVRLLVQIEAEFGCKLSLAALFAHPTIAAQARLLSPLLERAGAGPGGADPRAFDFRQVVKLQANGARAPLIAINNTGIYYALSKRLGPDQPFISLQLFDPSLPDAQLPRTLEGIAAGYAQLIRRVQPAGPYALLGWCVAGTLAFEVARQLAAAGQTVSQLVLFDTLAPGWLQRLSWHRAYLAGYSYRFKLIAADWARTWRGELPLSGFIANRTIVKKLLGRRTPAAADGGEPQLHRPLSPEQYDQWLLQYLEEAAASYQPRPYPGRMTLFRSSQEPAGMFLDPRMGWGDFVEGGMEVVVIEGDHFNIFQEPNVSRIAQRIGSAPAVAGTPGH
jgi:amino acid adenylation domain-containing protein